MDMGRVSDVRDLFGVIESKGAASPDRAVVPISEVIMQFHAFLVSIFVLLAVLGIHGQEPQTAADYFKRAEARAAKNDSDGAIADYTKAIEIDPKFVDAYCARAHGRYRPKDIDAAIADWDTCIALTPADDKYLFGHYFQRGEARSSKKDHDAAIADFTKSIELRPNHWAYEARAAAYSENVLLDRSRKDSKKERRDFQAAIVDFEWLMKKFPGYSLYYRNRGRLYANHRKYKAALVDYQKAIELEPKEAGTYAERAIIYRKLGKKKLAANDEKKAAELGKLHSRLYHRGGTRLAARS